MPLPLAGGRPRRGAPNPIANARPSSFLAVARALAMGTSAEATERALPSAVAPTIFHDLCGLYGAALPPTPASDVASTTMHVLAASGGGRASTTANE